jgi:comEA protein
MNKFSLYFALFLFIFIVSCVLIVYMNKDNDAVYLEVTRVVYVTNEITVIVPVTLPYDFSTTPAVTTFPYETEVIVYTTDFEPAVTPAPYEPEPEPTTHTSHTESPAAPEITTTQTTIAATVSTVAHYAPKPEPKGKININTAALDELTEIPGIGPVHAEKIIEYRNEHGSFKEISDLINVNGIGEKSFEKIKNYIRV